MMSVILIIDQSKVLHFTILIIFLLLFKFLVLIMSLSKIRTLNVKILVQLINLFKTDCNLKPEACQKTLKCRYMQNKESRISIL